MSHICGKSNRSQHEANTKRIGNEKSASRPECCLGTALLIAGGEGSSDHQTPEVAFEAANPVSREFGQLQVGRAVLVKYRLPVLMNATCRLCVVQA